MAVTEPPGPQKEHPVAQRNRCGLIFNDPYQAILAFVPWSCPWRNISGGAVRSIWAGTVESHSQEQPILASSSLAEAGSRPRIQEITGSGSVQDQMPSLLVQTASAEKYSFEALISRVALGGKTCRSGNCERNERKIETLGVLDIIAWP